MTGRIWTRLLGVTESPIRLLAVSVLLAGIVLGELNWLGAVRYNRFDLSAHGDYSLSDATLALLRGQKSDVELIVTLSPTDPLFEPLKHLIDTYRAASPLVRLTRIDPEREPLALKAAAGNSAAEDLALIARRDGERVFVTRDKLVRVEQSQVRVSMEQAISNAIADVLADLKVRVCFPTGHGEPSIDDVGKAGLAPLADHLTHFGYAAERVPLDVPSPAARLHDCSVIVVAAPERPYPREHERALESAFERGAAFLVLLPPIVGPSGTLAPSGLDHLLGRFGLKLERGFLVEEDPSHRLPEGMGELFFANPELHRITDGLSRGDERHDARPLVVTSGAITITDRNRATPLLKTSDKARLLAGFGDFDSAQATQSYVVAAAAELMEPTRPKARLTLFAYGTLLDSVSDLSLVANRILLENSLDWLIDRTPKVILPPRATRPREPYFTEESLSAVGRYVLFFIPGGAAALGALVIFLRRSGARKAQETRS